MACFCGNIMANFPSEVLDTHLSKWLHLSSLQTLPPAMAEEMATVCVLGLEFCLVSVELFVSCGHQP